MMQKHFIWSCCVLIFTTSSYLISTEFVKFHWSHKYVLVCERSWTTSPKTDKKICPSQRHEEGFVNTSWSPLTNMSLFWPINREGHVQDPEAIHLSTWWGSHSCLFQFTGVHSQIMPGHNEQSHVNHSPVLYPVISMVVTVWCFYFMAISTKSFLLQPMIFTFLCFLFFSWSYYRGRQAVRAQHIVWYVMSRNTDLGNTIPNPQYI